MRTLMWFRRDLRLGDNPALLAAGGSGPALPCFVLDPAFFDGAGPVRQAWLALTLRALDASLPGGLCLRSGDPTVVVPALAREIGASQVHIATESEPAGRARDTAVALALARQGSRLVATGSPYAVTPGRVLTRAGTGYRVFGPFQRAWSDHGWRQPATGPQPTMVPRDSDPAAWARLDAAILASPVPLPAAGEAAVRERWDAFLEDGLADYASLRDRPDRTGTSGLSPYLKFGVVHPRTLLADLAGRGEVASRFRTELAWREFYADVVHHHPGSVTADLHSLGIAYDDPGAGLEAWRSGTTGFPIVDAGMRQLARTGWMHNRVRMITASFLTKDLHLWWRHGADHFLAHLLDGDLASNSHGWQWVAGTGTDAAPYFRVFNPVRQGEQVDPDGDYVRTWVDELRHLPGRSVHQPWLVCDGYLHGYPERILDHGAEREEALLRYRIARQATAPLA